MGKTHQALQRAEKEYQEKYQVLKADTDRVDSQESQTRMPTLPSKSKPPVRTRVEGYRDQYDSLKINLFSRYPAEQLKLIVFTGTAYGDGNSTTAVNFVTSLAKDPKRSVCIIDANIQKPCLHQVFNQDLKEGLTDFLAAENDAEPRMARIQENLFFLNSGSIGNRSSGLLESAKFEDFLEKARDHFDHVILDCPPVSNFPETRRLASRADGVVLVVNAGITMKNVALRAKRDLSEAGATLLGVVLNKREYFIPRWLYYKV